ncbi:MAG: 16S rRNA (uracil(1498)-N(3))-methyltransferase [Chloroflexi bacterium]|nr:16S rRNA (uracil(1498)-N(3))-methyltransferase [Chloroflexota bacterium]
MHRFFVTHIEGSLVTFPEEKARQIRSVLRMQVGDQVVVLDNSGMEYDVQLSYVDKRRVLGEVVGKRPSLSEPAIQLTLCQAMLKRDNFEWVLQKGTEIGVTRFIPLLTERTVTTFKANKMTRWRKIIMEAAEQSHRGKLPELTLPMKLMDAFTQVTAADIGIIPWEAAQSISIADVVSESTAPAHIFLFIGPEGGFSAEEVANGRSYHIVPVTLGKRILRAETAAIVAATLAFQAVGELE